MAKKILLLLWTLTLVFQVLNSQNVKLNSGLIAHYLFNGDYADISGYQNDGFEYGGVRFTEDRFGNQCGALHFNGTDAYLAVPSSKSLKTPYRELSVAVWFRLDPGATDLKWLTVCCKSDLLQETDNSPQFRMQATRVTLSVNTEFTENLNKDIDFNVWYHYTMVYNGRYVKAYLNGQKYFEFPYHGEFKPNDMPMEIGRDIPGEIEYFAGTLDELRIYNRALNEDEIAAIYQDVSEKTSPKPCGPSPSTPATTPGPLLTPIAPRQPPVITVLNPNVSPYNALDAGQQIEARIEYISGKKDIEFKVNGQTSKNFTFDKTAQLFTAAVELESGNNVFEIKATNKDGEDADSGVIIYQVASPDPKPPVVTILTPQPNPYNAPAQTQLIEASIENISGKQDVEFKLNGQIYQDFDFSMSNILFTSTIPLEIGNNVFEIKATNKDGQDNKSAVVLYRPAARPPQPPVVNILTPDPSPYNSPTPMQQIEASIEYVASKDDIEFKLNGQISSDFFFDPASQRLNTTVPLNNGYNIIEIKAINQDGQDQDNGLIEYREAIPSSEIATVTPEEIGEVKIKAEREVGTPQVELVCYDNQREDGDIVSIYVDGRVYADKVELKTKGNRDIRIKLPPLVPNKEYIIVSKAWNLGQIPPNTMIMEVHDGTGRYREIVLESQIGLSEGIRLIYKQ